jgi:hypothetical protein
MNDYLPEMNYLTKEKPDDRYVCAVGVQSKTEADPDEAPVPRKSGISGAEVLAIPGIAAESGEVRLKITTLTLVPKVPSVPKVFKIKKWD